ncbi:MAG TPA: hypothetical protein VNR60_08575 [Croceibacterium sp.]|nr:hypothetical protein [Croceibacterium sp.]
MISLATTPTGNRPSLDLGETRVSGETKGAFSAVLAQHDPQEASAEKGEARPNAEALALAAAIGHGIALPETAESGKILPVGLPGDAALESGAESETVDVAAGGEAVEAALALAAMTQQIALPAASAEGDAEAETTPAETQQKAVQTAPIPQGMVRGAGEAKAEGAAAKDAPAQRDTAISIQVAQTADTQGGQAKSDDSAEGGDTGGEAPTARRDVTAADRAAMRFTQTETVKQPEQATLAAPTLSTGATPAMDAARPALRPDTLTEMTRMIDRLAAAREAFAPATDSVAIDHAEFGELSLRFDQRRDGALSVQLSASNPETQRAVAQAVGAQTFQNAADDRAGNSQQNQPQTAARGGGTADRDGASGNGTAARHDQNAPQQQQRRVTEQPNGGGSARAGVFA